MMKNPIKMHPLAIALIASAGFASSTLPAIAQQELDPREQNIRSLPESDIFRVAELEEIFGSVVLNTQPGEAFFQTNLLELDRPFGNLTALDRFVSDDIVEFYADTFGEEPENTIVNVSSMVAASSVNGCFVRPVLFSSGFQQREVCIEGFEPLVFGQGFDFFAHASSNAFEMRRTGNDPFSGTFASVDRTFLLNGSAFPFENRTNLLEISIPSLVDDETVRFAIPTLTAAGQFDLSFYQIIGNQTNTLTAFDDGFFGQSTQARIQAMAVGFTPPGNGDTENVPEPASGLALLCLTGFTGIWYRMRLRSPINEAKARTR